MNYRIKISSLRRRRLDQSAGISLPEILIGVVVIGIFSGIAIPSFFFLLQRERIQSVALEVAGWIEQVRNVAADEVSSVATSGGCELRFSEGPLSAGGILARLGQGCNVPGAPFLVPDGIQSDSIQVSIQGPNPIIFTPRGLWINDQGEPGSGFVLEMVLSGTGNPRRCVRLTPTLGSVEIGRPDGGNSCSNWQSL